MPPGPGSAKRKRPDRQYSQDEGRPSPHRPESLAMAQHQSPRFEGRGRGDGRRGRGGRGGHMGDNRRSQRPAEPEQKPMVTTEPTASPATPQMKPQPAPTARLIYARAIPASRAPSPPLDDTELMESEHFSDESIATWVQGGKDRCKEAILAQSDPISEAEWVQELVNLVLHKKLDSAVAGAFFAEVNEARKTAASGLATEDVFVDTVGLLPPSDWKRGALSRLIFASGVPASSWRIVLESDGVEALSLTREKFAKKKAGKITNYLYRQANYNLLREESQGYAKLVTTYFDLAQNASALDSPPTIALDAFERVKALIGTFDLDVGRVLDISLDVFANLLVRNFRFFVKYIRASSWWPSLDCPDIIKWRGQGFDNLPEWALPSSKDWGVGSEEVERLARLAPLIQARDADFWTKVQPQGISAFHTVGAKIIVNLDDEAVVKILNTEVQPSKDDVDAKGAEKNKAKRIRVNDRLKWMLKTGTLPPTGNHEAAELLGFKLSFYYSPARDASDTMPENLIYLSALLIKVGFISLYDLYPHLYPADEKMNDVRSTLEKELQERELANRPGGGLNKLAMSGSLPDDTLPSNPAVKNLKDGAAGSKASSPKPEASPQSEPPEELPEPPNQKIMLLKSLLAIGALPEALTILGRFPWLADLVPDLPSYIHRILHHMLSKMYEPVRPLEARSDLSRPHDHVGDSVGLPKGQLRLVPTNLRPAKRWAQLDKPDDGDGVSFKFYWDDWSLNIPVCQTVDDVFLLCGSFLKLSGVKIGTDASLVVKLARIGRKSLIDDRSTENESRWIDLLKRLLVPALSLTSKNPSIANAVYDLLRMFPTSTRYAIYAEWHFGPTSRLPDVQRAFKRTQFETRDVLKRISKTNVRPMGKTLAKVAYGSPGIVLQTAINQMESYENLIEVFVECSRYFTFLGYDVLTWCLLNALGGRSRNPTQDDGMLTSPWLRALSTFAGAIYKRYATCDPTPLLQNIASELRSQNSTELELLEQMIVAMVGIKSDMAYNDSQVLAMSGGELLQAQTLKQMADERHKCEKSAKRFIKALVDSGLAAQIMISIAQERQLFSSHAKSSDRPLKVLGSNVDKIHQVFVQYLEALRSGLTVEHFAELIPDPLHLIADFGLDVEIAFMIGRAGIANQIAAVDARKRAEMLDKNRTQTNEVANTEADTAMTDASPPVDGEVTAAEENGTEASKPNDDVWHPALTEFIERLPTVIGEDVAATLSVPFYITFWSLGLHDIMVNNATYDQELAHQTSLMNQLRNDRSDPSAGGQKERERQIRAIANLKDNLGKEMRGQIAAYTQVRNRLFKEKDHWFEAFHQKPGALHNSLLQNCFLPRILVSPLDSQFTFTMIKFLHNNGTPGFSTVLLFDLFFKKSQLTSIIFSVTAREAENLGRFISESMKELMSWHNDQATYEKNAYGNKRQLLGFKNNKSGELFSFQEFRYLLYKWQTQLKDVLKTCLESPEYMHIRNAIIVLKALPPSFPVVNQMVTELTMAVTNLSKNETRGDLKLAATSLLGNLKPQEKLVWTPNNFKVATGKREEIVPPVQAASDAKPSALNAEAPDFKPGVATNGSHEAEDGEIDDEKKTSTNAANVNAKAADSPTMMPTQKSVQSVRRGEDTRQSTPSRAQTPKAVPQSSMAANQRETPRGGPGPRSDFGRLDRPSDLDQSQSRSNVRQNDNRRDGRPELSERDSRAPIRNQRAETPRNVKEPSGPPRPPSEAPRSAAAVNGSNASVSAPPKDVAVNPARLAMIENAQRFSSGSPQSRNDNSKGRSSGGNSPRRDVQQMPPYQGDRRPAPAGYNDRRNEDAPSGPRQDRVQYQDSPRRPQENVFEPRIQPRVNQDPNYGRLNTTQSPARGSDGPFDRPEKPPPAGPKSTIADNRPTPSAPQSRTPGTSPTIGSQGWQPRSRAPVNSAPATPAQSAAGALPPGPAGPAPSGGRPQRGQIVGVSTPEAGRNDRQLAVLNQTLQGSTAQNSSRSRPTRPNGSAAPQDAPPANMPPPHAGGRVSELQRSASTRDLRGRNAPPPSSSRTPPRGSYDQGGDMRHATRGAPFDPARDAMKDDAYRRSEYRPQPEDIDMRGRGPGPQDDYRGYGPPGGPYRDDGFARGPPGRPAGAYPPDARGYGPGPGPEVYPGPRRPMDDGRGPMAGGPRQEYRGPDSRPGFGPGRGEYRDDRPPAGPSPARHDDRKRRAEDMGSDQIKRRRSGGQ